MGNDVTWWRDRDEWMPGIGHDPPPRAKHDEEEHTSHEDIGDVADDNPEEVDDSNLPDRGPDH